MNGQAQRHADNERVYPKDYQALYHGASYSRKNETSELAWEVEN